jgi:hypothetical protein
MRQCYSDRHDCPVGLARMAHEREANLKVGPSCLVRRDDRDSAQVGAYTSRVAIAS